MLGFLAYMAFQLALPLGGVLLALWLFSRSSAGRGMLTRFRGDSVDPVLVHQLAQDVESLREELGAVQERLDFTERMLAQRTGPNPPGEFHAES